MKTTEYLLDRLAEATISAPVREYVAIQPLSVGRETTMGLLQHPPARVVFPALRLGAHAVLHLGYGIKEVAWDRIRSGVRFDATLLDARGAEHRLLQVTVDPARTPNDRGWWDRAIELAEWRNQEVKIRLTTSLTGSDGSYAWAAWSGLRVEHEAPTASPPARRRDTYWHVLLITADALRRDHLGCYGHPTVTTPHLDRLAQDGSLFLEARTQSTTTLGAYASLLTGQFPPEHGIVAEWGELPSGIGSLPRQLARHGYHTVLAFSEDELRHPEAGFVPMFDDCLPCLAVPAQSGDITARAFDRWLDRRPDQPFFAWLQFFDAHPPCRPPEPFRSMYYQDDPSDPRRRDRVDLVKGIRGVETVIDLLFELDRSSGEPVDTTLVERLDATAEVLVGTRTVGPDLVQHLVALGPGARRGMERRALGAWLAGEVRRLRSGIASPALRDWLRSILPALRDIEAEILAWLSHVEDFRYPLSQYMAQVTHLDRHVGTVLDGLRERGLYEQTLVVVTAPHGEVLNAHGVLFDHHVLMEDVLRVPLLIKPGARPEAGPVPVPGARLAGVCDIIDLAPTVLEALQLPVPGDLSGAGRWRQVCTGAPIPEHDSFAVEMCGAMVALARPPHVFVRARAPYRRSDEWRWQTGQTALFRLQEPMSYAEDRTSVEPHQAAAFDRRLAAWLAQMPSVAATRTADGVR